jgi:uncharacterized protein (UPF0335 family)
MPPGEAGEDRPDLRVPAAQIGVQEMHDASAERLTNYIERIETLEEEKAALAGDLKEVYAEAKLEGFDPKVLRQVVRLRKLEEQEREEQESLLHMYMQALGMYGGASPEATAD